MLELDPLLSVGRPQNDFKCRSCDSPEVNLENAAVFSPIFQELLTPQATQTELFGQMKVSREVTDLGVHPSLSETTRGKLRLDEHMPATKWQSGKTLPGLTMPLLASAFSKPDIREAEPPEYIQLESLPREIPSPYGGSTLLNSLFINDPTDSNRQKLFQFSISVLETPFKHEDSVILEQLQKPVVPGDNGDSQLIPSILESQYAIKSLSYAEGLTALDPGNIANNYNNNQIKPSPYALNLAQAETAFMETRSLLPNVSELEVDLRAPNWEQGFGEKMIWLAGKHIQTASLKLNPPELGPVEVELAIKKDQIHINFITHGVQAKEALDFAIPKLRELFLLSGMNLVDVNVADQQAHYSPGRFFNHADMSEFFYANSTLEEEYDSPASMKTISLTDIDISENLLDVYI